MVDGTACGEGELGASEGALRLVSCDRIGDALIQSARRWSMRAVLPVLFSLVMVVPALAQTHVTEGISSDTTWDIGGSPYIVHGDVSVGGHSTLTIDPGVTVRFDTGAKLSIQSESTIVAVGIPGSEILFTSDSVTPAPNDWQSVYLFYAVDSVLIHCIFEYGRYNLYCDRSHPTISFCTTRSASSVGIYCELASPQITGCNIIDNTTGIRVAGPFAFPEIHYSNLYDNHENMYLSGYDSEPVAEIHAENNWWGVDSYLEIGDTINITMGAAPYVTVLYDPWLEDVPVEGSSWTAIKAMFNE
jgi:hypothetical protein